MVAPAIGMKVAAKTIDDDDDGDYTRQEIVAESLRDHLLNQLKLMPLSERDQNLVFLLIDSINEDGYLEESLEELAESLPLRTRNRTS